MRYFFALGLFLLGVMVPWGLGEWMQVRQVPMRAHAVALTFEGGPFPPFTEQYLELLAQYGAHATFFLSASAIERFPLSAALLRERGHEIGVFVDEHSPLAEFDRALPLLAGLGVSLAHAPLRAAGSYGAWTQLALAWHTQRKNILSSYRFHPDERETNAPVLIPGAILAVRETDGVAVVAQVAATLKRIAAENFEVRPVSSLRHFPGAR